MRLLFILTFFISSLSHAQMYVMNVDFSGASGAEMPLGWTNNLFEGEAGTDTWRFDNPGGRSILFPMSAPFAIFDAGAISGEGLTQRVALESRPFNAAASNFILLMFDHTFEPGPGEQVSIEVFDGDMWHEVALWSSVTANPQSQIVDISAHAGGVNGARFRFIWHGRGLGYWAIDNIRVYDARPRDAAMLDISSPTIPFPEGSHTVGVNMANFGSQNLNSTTISWSVDDVQQSDVLWNGNLAFGEIAENIELGQIDFQGPVNLKVWQSMPNGDSDFNNFNDTIERVLRPSMNGTYYIGGAAGDFSNFSEAANALQTSGIDGPVIFNVREGLYVNQFTINRIHGISEENTVTFVAENGNPSSTRVEFYEWLQPTARFNDAAHIAFYQIGFSGHHAVIIEKQSHNLVFEDCVFEASGAAIVLQSGASEITFLDNTFGVAELGLKIGEPDGIQTTDIYIQGNTFRDIRELAISLTNSNTIDITGNRFQDVPGGIKIDHSDQVTINGNRIHQLADYGYANIGIAISHSTGSFVYNNFIYTRGVAASVAMRLDACHQSRVFFNTVNTTNTDATSDSRSMHIRQGSDNVLKNNIFFIAEQGCPMVIDGDQPGLTMDRNNYFGPYDIVGRINNVSYYQLDEWRVASGQDQSSTAANPFFASDGQPDINQAQLYGRAEAIPGIPQDIDGTARKTPPDIGAKEYNPCIVDAGINRIIAPARSIAPGLHMVSVELQNHGTSVLSSVDIIWSVNGIPQSLYQVTGVTIQPGDYAVVDLGEYDFSGFFNVVEASTDNPNSDSDCNIINDRAVKSIVANGPMCGDFTIGGINPHFNNFTDAVLALRTAGINCDVTFYVRDGVYEEQIDIVELSGSDEGHLVRFISESGNNEAVTLSYLFPGQAPLRLSNAQNIEFSDISVDGYIAALISGQSENIRFEQCRFSAPVIPGVTNKAIGVSGNPNGIYLEDNIFSGGHTALNISMSEVPLLGIHIRGNAFSGSKSAAISVNGPGNIHIVNNTFENMGRAIYVENSRDILVHGNSLSLATANWVENTGMDFRQSQQIRIFNNTITYSGASGANAIKLENLSESGIYFNSIRMLNNAPGASVRGLWMQQGNNNEVFNNILYTANHGYPVHLEGPVSSGTLNHNNFFSNRGLLGRFNQTNFSDLAGWIGATGQDQQSLSENPFFDDDLAINQVLLDGKGVPVPGIMTDIYGIDRDPLTPDPGAIEYTPLCGLDAGINRLVSPESIVAQNPDPAIETDIVVLLQNHGTEILTSVTIHVEISAGVITTPLRYNWNGSIAAGQNASVNIGSFRFDSGLYQIEAWTSGPNDGDDCNTLNDKTVTDVVASLSGDYLIGGPGADFADFTEAADVLNAAGISGNVRFIINEAIYADRFLIGNIPGAGTAGNVIFMAEPGAEVWIRPGPGSIPILTLHDTQNVVFSNIGFDGIHAVLVEDLSSDIVFENCTFRVDYMAIQLTTGVSDLYLRGNTFTPKGLNRPGHYVFLRWDKVQAFENIVIQDNVFSQPAFEAIHAYGVRNMLISGNHFEDIRRGILANDVGDLEIAGNWFYIQTDPAETNIGMVIEDGFNALIYNNFIRSQGAHQVTGIKLFNNRENRIYFNTVNITNNDSQSKALWLNQCELSEVKNNVFNIKHVGFPIFIDFPAVGLDLDFNNYFSQNGIVGSFGSPISNLSQWGDMVNGDSSSSSFNPLFYDDDNPLPREKFLNGAGIPIDGIAVDIFNASRDELAPDMGCLEFVIDYGILALVTPGNACDLTDEERITVTVERLGEIPLDEVRIRARINEGPYFEITIDGHFDEPFECVFPDTYDFSVPGDYEIYVELFQVSDDNLNNDNATFYRYVRESPIVGIDLDISCSHVQLLPVWRDTEEPGTSLTWHFGDGTTSEDMYPVHSYPGTETYTVSINIITESGCYIDFHEQVFVDVPTQPLGLSATVTDQSCAGNSDASILLNVNGGVPPYTVIFDDEELTYTDLLLFDNLLPGQYLFEATDSHHCVVSATYTISAAEPLNPRIIYTERTYVAPVTLTFSYESNENRGIDEVFWQSGTQESTDGAPAFYFDEPGTYTVTLQVFSGIVNPCMEETSVVFEIDLREMSIDVRTIQRRCIADEPASIRVPIDGGTPPFQVTLLDDAQNALEVRVLSQTYSTTFVDVPPGNYLLRVEDRYDQRIQGAVTIDNTIEMSPVIYGSADFGISPFEVEFWFEANSNVRHIEWQYNDQTSQELQPIFRFVGDGDHLVYLTVFSGNPDDSGVCAEIAGPFVVRTEQQVVIQVPDIITPNGDGLHDHFEVLQKNLQQIDVQILDRRGVLVYAYDDLEGFWDGNYSNGKEAPDAMYYYHLKGVGFDDIIHTRSGMFQLIRETIHVFPNPASGLVNIDWPGRIKHVVEVGVYDLRGNRVMFMQEITSTGLVQLDISGLEDGIYLVRVSDGAKAMNAKLHVLKR